ncbi:MAG TPA: hypothetical protein VFO30_04475 [Chthoniobacterales bacterium]|nr:hypothetical protein [Chthoniobacterales bacterium]
MKATAVILASAAALVVGCRATRDVVETSYHVATAPVRLVHRAIAGGDEPPPPVTSDVVTNPGRPVPPSSPTPSRQWVAESRTSTRQTEAPKTKAPTPSPRTAAAGQQQFPTAKPVPGKPGLVYNPYDPNGAYIDVTGYAPGSKVKDPDSQKIFVVP